MNGRKAGPVRRTAYRLADWLDRQSRRDYAAWCAVGSGGFGVLVCLLLPPVPMPQIVVVSMLTGWLCGWFMEGDRK